MLQRTRPSIAAIITAICLCFSVQISAQARTLEVVSSEWPPYTTATLETGGLVYEILSAAFAQSGYAFKGTIVPWPRALATTKSGKTDGLPAWYSKERAEELFYSDPLIINRLVFVTKIENKFTWSTIDDLRPYSFILLNGAIYTPEFDARTDLNKNFTSKEATALRQVAAGRYDAMVGDEGMIQNLLNTELANFGNKITVVEPPLSNSALHYTVSRSHPEASSLIRAVNEGLKKITANGEYDAILDKYKARSISAFSK